MINYDFLSNFNINLEFNAVTSNHLKSVVEHLRTIPVPMAKEELLKFGETLKKIKKLAKNQLHQSQEITTEMKDRFITIIKAKEVMIEARKKEMEAYELFDGQFKKEKEEPKSFITIMATHPNPPEKPTSHMDSHSSSTSSKSSIPPLSEASRAISSTSTQTPALPTSHLSQHEPNSIVSISKSRDLALRNDPNALFQVKIEELQQVTSELAQKPKLDIDMKDKIENSLDVFKLDKLRFLDNDQLVILSEELGGLSEEFMKKPNHRLYNQVYSGNLITLLVEINSILNSREDEKDRIAENKKAREKDLKQLCDQMNINVDSQPPLTSQALIVFKESDLENQMKILFNEIDRLSMKSTIDWPSFWGFVDRAFVLIAQECTDCIVPNNLDAGFFQLKMIMTRLNNLSTSRGWGDDDNYRLSETEYQEYIRKFGVLNKAVSALHASLKQGVAAVTAPTKPVKQNDFASKKQSLDKLVEKLRSLSPTRSNKGLELIEKFFMIAYDIHFETYTSEELNVIQSNLIEVENFAKTFKSSTNSIYAQHLINMIETLKKTPNRKISEPEDKNEPYLPKEYIEFLEPHLENFDNLKNHEKMALYKVLQNLGEEILYIVGDEGKMLNTQIERLSDKITLILNYRELDFPESNMLSMVFGMKDMAMPKEFDALSLLSPQEQKTLTPSVAAETSLKYKRKLFADMKEAKELALKKQNQKKIDLLNLFHSDKAPLRLSRSNSNNGESTNYGSPSLEEQQIISGFMAQFFKKD